MLNTGSIQTVDSTVTVLKSEGHSEMASAVTSLSEAVIKSTTVGSEQKDQILELLGALSQEAVAPKEKRKLTVARTLITELSAILGGIAALSQVWERSLPIFQKVFGL